jgi:hypothetical protein
MPVRNKREIKAIRHNIGELYKFLKGIKRETGESKGHKKRPCH